MMPSCTRVHDMHRDIPSGERDSASSCIYWQMDSLLVEESHLPKATPASGPDWAITLHSALNNGSV